MSDNTNSKIQDRGWAGMSGILDKEMPVRRNRRFPFILILGVLLIGILGYYSWDRQNVNLSESDSTEMIYLNETSPIKSADLTISDNYSLEESEPIGKENIGALENVVLNLEPKTESKSTTLMVSSSIQDANSNNTTDQLRLAKNTSQHGTHSSSITPVSQPNPTIIQSGASEKRSVIESRVNQPKTKIEIDNGQLFNQIENNDTKIESTPTSNNIDSPKNERSLIPFLQQLPYLPQVIKKEKTKTIADPVVITQKDFAYRPYVSVSVNNQNSNSLLGIGFGGGVSKETTFGNVYVGLSYNQTKFSNQQAFDVANEISISDNNAGDLPEGGIPYMGDLNVPNFSDLTVQFNSLNLSLGLQKKLHSKVSLDFGFTYSKLLSAVNKDVLVELNTTFGINEKSYQSIQTTELYDKGAYSSYDLVPSIGFDFLFTENLSISLIYNYGLKNQIANQELDNLTSLSTIDEIYRRSVEGKVIYKF